MTCESNAMEKMKQELIFTNGTIYIDADKKAENLYVEDGTVKAINIDPALYGNATIINLEGGYAYPGFCDSHVHLVEVGITYGGADLQGCSTADQISKVIAEHVKKMPEGEPMFGLGFYPQDYDAWSLEDLAKIDEVTPGRAVMLMDSLGHNCIINSLAIDICGLTAETEIPMGGKLVLQNGKPTGMLRESAMTIAGNSLFPFFSNETIKTGARKLFDHWSSLGYTSIVDMMGAPFGRLLKPDICMELEKEKALPVRVNYMYTFSNLNEIDDALGCKGNDTEMLRFGGLKLFVDGAYAGGQAWTSWKNLQGDNGLYYVFNDDSYGKQYNLNRIVDKVNELGLNIHYHVQGNQAIEVVLDALEAAKKKKGHLTSTHTLIHLAFPTNEQIDRMKSFDGHVLATVQPAFWQIEESSTRYYGKSAKNCYPIKKLIDAGISTGISTDYSVSPIELAAPSTIMGIAMTGAGDPVNHQPLTMRELINGFTTGSAATSSMRDIGTLDIGYKADIVVYNKDLYSISKNELTEDNPKVLSTWISGSKVYDTR